MNTENKKIQLITEVITKSVILNDKTDTCVFIDYSGHIDRLKIRITESKENYNNEIASCDLKLTPFRPYSLNKEYLETFNKDIINELTNISNILSEIIAENKTMKNKLIDRKSVV